MVDRKTAMAAIRYSLTRAYQDRKHKRQKPHGQFQTLGAVNTIQQHERGITISSSRGSVRLTLIAPDCIQVRFQTSGKFAVPFSYAAIL